jgi:hypothetical protein
MAVQGSTLWMTWKKMSAVGIFRHTKLHGVRIAHEKDRELRQPVYRWSGCGPRPPLSTAGLMAAVTVSRGQR